ncbi:4Fe-4S ferredoxin [Vulcanisaeta thermophila]|uniref:4Fe-4S ferredoxin n=1 Tax=Vulcanisaeta thermophila TaxID=867917 RepID=UPI00085332E4|nr:4Fe-4S ferredoxin [Vulcanisaeta thermophila]
MSDEAWLWSTWVKAQPINNADVVIVAACLRFVNPRIYEEVTKGKVVLLACPEREHAALYGKIASMFRSSRPRSLTIVSIDGSPHCALLHASANEAEYILNEDIPKRHFVVVDGKELREISPDAVRVARYLSIVDNLIKENPHALNELARHSLEYVSSLKRKGK